MSKENARVFVQAVLNDEELRGKTANMKPEEVIAFAKEMGFDFTLDELKEVKKDDIELDELKEVKEKAIELDDEELGKVAGGAYYERDYGTYMYKVMTEKYVDSHYCWVKGLGRTKKYGPLHDWVVVGHKEEPILGGCLSWLGGWTNGYDILKCSRCGADGIRNT